MWNLDLRVDKPCTFGENLYNMYCGDYVEETYDGEEFLYFHKQFNNQSDYINWIKPLYDSLQNTDYYDSLYRI